MPIANTENFLPVIMGTGLNAYNLARSIHLAYGVPSLALGRYALRETADSRIVTVRTVPNFDTAEGAIETLLQVAEEHPDQKLLLIPTIEFYTNAVLEHREQIAAKYQIPLVAKALADKLMNKTDFYATCAALGIPHPTTVTFGAEEPLTALANNLSFAYPVILKPSNTDIYPRINFEGRQKVYLVQDSAELVRIAEKIFAAGYDDDLVVQEYLAGDESVMRVANTYSDKNGQMKFLSIGQVILTEYNPSLVGNNNAIVTIDDPELGESIRRLVEGVGYTGAANFDIMLDQKTGVSKILEINLRPGATAFYTMAAGGNLASYFVEDQIFDRPLAPFTTTQERLWLNVPYPVAAHFAPASTKPLLHKTAKHGITHTLKYAPDLSVKRRIDISRVDARHSLDYLKYAKQRLNK